MSPVPSPPSRSSYDDDHSSDQTTEQICAAHFDATISKARAKYSSSASLRNRLDIQDVESAAVWGLFRAARSWDGAKGPFGPWLHRVVSFEIQEAARASTPVPARVVTMLKRLQAAEMRLERDGATQPSDDALAVEVGATVDEIAALRLLRNTAREPKEVNDTTQAVVDDAHDLPSDLVDGATEAFAALAADDQVMVALHYFEDIPFKEIAGALQQRQDKISRSHRRALTQMASYLQWRLQYQPT